MRKTLTTVSQVNRPKTGAMKAFERNLEGVAHMLKASGREIALVKASAAKMVAFVKPLPDLKSEPARTKFIRSVTRFSKNLTTGVDRYNTIKMWQAVILVTCVEAYLQDVLTAAARVDKSLMSRSEQSVLYAEVVEAASLELLADDMRTRWARGWLNEGGPKAWISRLQKMGARGYAEDLGSRLELLWGIRHLVVHAAGIATADFVKRHSNFRAAVGQRIHFSNSDLTGFLNAVKEFVEPTEIFVLARWPSLIVHDVDAPLTKPS